MEKNVNQSMEKKKVRAIIGKSRTGFTIMMEGFDLAMSYGDTLEEAKRDFEKFPEEYVAVSREAGKEIPPELNGGALEFEYVYDLSGFFAFYDFISPSKVARRMGINPSLMRQYASGCTYLSYSKKKEIERRIRGIGRELMGVSF
jgi:predicted RNase H-like HicB family nuclease